MSVSANFARMAVLSLLCLASLGLLGATVLRDREETLREAQQGAEYMARLLEEYTQSHLLAGELQMDRVAGLVAGRPMAEVAADASIGEKLRAILAIQPFHHSVWVIDAEGRVAATNAQGVPPGLDLKSREYFRAVKAGQERYINPLLWGKATGDFLFTQARALRGPGGEFRGVIALSIKADAFTDFHARLRPPFGTAFSLVKEDGSLVNRAPPAPFALTEPLRQGLHDRITVSTPTLMKSLLERSEGHFELVRSPIDGVSRLVGYRRVVGTDMIAIAALDRDMILAQWIDRSMRSLGIGAGALAALAVMLYFLWRSVGAEIAAKRLLEVKAAELEVALADKDVLFQEVHHRVKNNLQIISSMLTMQSLSVQDEALKAQINDALGRIHSIGLVHHTLYLQDEAAMVDMGVYLSSLVERIAGTQGAAQRGIRIETDCGPVRLDLERAVPLALIANEVLTNAFNHAFPGDRQGCIRLSLRAAADGHLLEIEDDGVGLPETRRQGSIGLHIIKGLVRQLAGRSTHENTGSGTRFTLHIPEGQPAKTAEPALV